MNAEALGLTPDGEFTAPQKSSSARIIRQLQARVRDPWPATRDSCVGLKLIVVTQGVLIGEAQGPTTFRGWCAGGAICLCEGVYFYTIRNEAIIYLANQVC